jgi:hypothetical protein
MPLTGEKIREALGVDAATNGRDGVLVKNVKHDDQKQDHAKSLWDRWTGRVVKGIRLF